MEKMNLRTLAKQHKLSKNSIASVLLNSSESSDVDLAMALKKTKPYKEDPELKAAVDAVLSTKDKVQEPKKPEQKSNTGRGGEPRR